MPANSAGALVPSVKSDNDPPPAVNNSVAGEPTGGGESADDDNVDSDFLCPICMQIIKDAFLTACGHSFCYMCIVTHVRNRSDCPCCERYLCTELIFPNFALDKLLKKMSNRQYAKCASTSEHIRLALQQGSEVSLKDLDSLLSQLSEKKRRMEREEAETNLEILLDFLLYLRKRRVEELSEVQNDLQYIQHDIDAVQNRKMDLSNVNSRLTFGSKRAEGCMDIGEVSTFEGTVAGGYSGGQALSSGYRYPHNEDGDAGSRLHSLGLLENDVNAHAELQHLAPSRRFVARKRQIQGQFKELQECYLQKRRHWVKKLHAVEGRTELNDASSGGYHPGLKDFQSVLTAFTRYRGLRVISELRRGNVFHPANIISSIEFNRDDELFATAGVSRRIKVFEYSSVVNEPQEVHCAAVDIASRSKLSCLSWNKYTKHYIASSDYDGIVNVWDITTRQSVREYEEHEKRAWSVDFSLTEPSLLLSGGDDCKVKVWCTRQEESVLNLKMKANICSVKCNPGCSMQVAVGSADHHTYYYDLRNVSQPLYVFTGHRKAVSYVKFLSSHELASASTDSTLRLWDVKDNQLLQIYEGHMNERNFVGLSGNREYLTCGSETNEVFVYQKAISSPIARYRFNTSEADHSDEDRGSYFVSAVCWKSDNPVIMAANSQGMIKVLTLTQDMDGNITS